MASARAMGERPVVQWLGTRSFSLYLVHEPIIVAVAFAQGADPNVVSILAVGVPLSLLVAELFYRFVEVPSHGLSRAAHRRVVRWQEGRRRAEPVLA